MRTFVVASLWLQLAHRCFRRQAEHLRAARRRRCRRALFGAERERRDHRLPRRRRPRPADGPREQRRAHDRAAAALPLGPLSAGLLLGSFSARTTVAVFASFLLVLCVVRDAEPRRSATHRASTSSTTCLGLKLLPQESVDDLRVGFALRLLHHLADEEAEHALLAAAVGRDLIRVCGEHARRSPGRAPLRRSPRSVTCTSAALKPAFVLAAVAAASASRVRPGVFSTSAISRDVHGRGVLPGRGEVVHHPVRRDARSRRRPRRAPA